MLGCGVDICYPREHRGLYCDILKEGGLLSEQLPGEPPLAGYFPARNRIISGLSDLVLVMEAKERSGSLITADMALEEGKDVFALPGLATSPDVYKRQAYETEENLSNQIVDVEIESHLQIKH